MERWLASSQFGWFQSTARRPNVVSLLGSSNQGRNWGPHHGRRQRKRKGMGSYRAPPPPITHRPPAQLCLPTAPLHPSSNTGVGGGVTQTDNPFTSGSLVTARVYSHGTPGLRGLCTSADPLASAWFNSQHGNPWSVGLSGNSI